MENTWNKEIKKGTLVYMCETKSWVELFYLVHNFYVLPPTSSRAGLTWSLERRWETRAFLRGFVKIAASWPGEETELTLRRPSSTFSRTKWNSKAICFERVLMTRFLVKKIAPALLHNKRGGSVMGARKSEISCLSHNNFALVYARDRYSASVLERATTFCFRDV